MAAATDAAVAAGWILPPDAIDLMTRACAAKVRFPDAARPCPAYEPPAYDTAPVEPTETPAAAPADDAAHESTNRGTLPATGGPQALAVPAVALLLGLALWSARTGT